MKVIVFTNTSGGVSVMTPVLATNAINDEGVWLPLRTGQTPPEGYRYPTIEEVAAKDCVIKIYKKDENGQFVLDENGLRIVERLEPIPHIIIDDSTLPDRDKREGWVIQDGAVVIDESRLPQPTPADNAKALLATLPDEMKAKHYSAINNVRAAIENDEWGVVPHLLAAVTPDTQEEAAALQQISEALGAN